MINLFFESVFANLLSFYEFMMNQQTISQQRSICWERRELFVYPAMFPNLPEHLASRYVILYAYNTIQVHEPQAETDSLKLLWFWPDVCS